SSLASQRFHSEEFLIRHRGVHDKSHVPSRNPFNRCRYFASHGLGSERFGPVGHCDRRLQAIGSQVTVKAEPTFIAQPPFVHLRFNAWGQTKQPRRFHPPSLSAASEAAFSADGINGFHFPRSGSESKLPRRQRADGANIR